MMMRFPLFATLLILLGCGSQSAGPTSTSGTPATATTANTTTPTTDTAAAAPKGFAAEVAKLGLILDTPAGYSEITVRENRDVTYQHALLSADQRIEMRFAIRLYGADLPEPMRTRQFSWTFFMTGIMNLTHGGQTGDSAPPVVVHHDEFGADDARMVIMRFHDIDKPEYFGNGYQLCVAVYLHRDSVGDAYTFVLFKDESDLKNMNEPTIHSFRFASGSTQPR